MEAARVRDAVQGGARTHERRTNTGLGLSLLHADIIVQLVLARLAAALGEPVSHQEPSNLLHYALGQEYKPHVDYLDPAISHNRAELQRLGQRRCTALVYLNDTYQGGETDFPRLGWRFKGGVGDALLFRNLRPDGQPDLNSLHAGLAPSTGEKWLLSLWVRDRPYPSL